MSWDGDDEADDLRAYPRSKNMSITPLNSCNVMSAATTRTSREHVTKNEALQSESVKVKAVTKAW
jgi:hypothetical protein